MANNIVIFIIRHNKALLLLSVLLVVISGFGLPRLGLESGMQVFFAKNDPNLQAQLALEKKYGKPDNILFVLESTEGDFYDDRQFQLLARLTERAWQIPYSRRVDSITNFQHAAVDGDDISIEALADIASSMPSGGLDTVKKIVLAEELLQSRLISPDGKVAGINVQLEVSAANKATAIAEAMTYARALSDELSRDHSVVEIHLAGWAATEQTLAEVTAADGQTLIPILLLLVLALLAFILRSLLASLTTLLVIIGSVIYGMGFAGWAGIPLNSVNIAAPTIILTLAVADCVHLFSALLRELNSGKQRKEALHAALNKTLYPIFLTSITTAIGFLSMTLSESPPFQQLGIISSVGVIGALVLTAALLPGLILLLPFSPQSAPPRINLEGFAPKIVRHHKGIFWISTSVVLVLVLFISRIELNDDPTGYFSKNVPLQHSMVLVEQRLSGTQTLDFDLIAGGPGAVLAPAFLAGADKFAEWLRHQPEVVNVEIFTNTLKRLNQVMHGGDTAKYQLPESRELAAQYTLLYEMSVPYGLDTTSWLTRDKSSIRVTATLKNQKSEGIIAFEQRSRAWLADNNGWTEVRGTGQSISFAHIGLRNINSMLSGSALALLLISLCLMVAFRSIKYGLVSLIPNFFPALTALGAWALMVGEVNIAASVVFSLTLGIIVDDTTHFLVKYLQFRRRSGATVTTALEGAFAVAGNALVTTTTVLVCGFSVLTLSDFSVNATTGQLVAITLVIALVLDLTLLPAVLIKLDPWLTGESTSPGTGDQGKEVTGKLT